MADEPGQTSERAYLPPVAPPTNHGHTLAAWVTVVTVIVGGTLAAVGVLVAEVWLFVVGLAVALLGVVAGRVLKALGLGQQEPSGPPPGSPRSGSDVDQSPKEQ